ncbi:MAG: Plug domain-containing protein, partial [Gammaproteobacteria bacterium]|nr:Plug domain-containing protein [Gammaproteobacteria bacterium]
MAPTLSGLLLLVLAGASAALARAADDLFDLPLADLLQVEIRSAGKRDEEIRDIPASVTILTREEIQRYGWVTFEELLRNVPGFFVLDTLDEQPIGTRGVAG